jgi:hypothetical protein
MNVQPLIGYPGTWGYSGGYDDAFSGPLDTYNYFTYDSGK